MDGSGKQPKHISRAVKAGVVGLLAVILAIAASAVFFFPGSSKPKSLLPEEPGTVSFTATAEGYDESNEVDVTALPRDVEITHCPQYLVPGHENKIKYRIYPDDFTALTGTIEIFDRNAPEAGPVFSDDLTDLDGGTEHTYVYSGTEISDGQFEVKITIDDCASDSANADVVAFEGSLLFWDEMVNNFASGLNISTVTTQLVATKVKCYDEEAFSDNQDNSATEIPDGEHTHWYYERGGVDAALSSYTFYAMSEDDQWYEWKHEVQLGGVLDNAQNEFDLEPDSSARQIGYRWKIRIGGDGNITVLEPPQIITEVTE